jgi:activator of HSP90 ATPase
MKLRTHNIFQVVEVNASPSSIYSTLMNSGKHAKFTEMKAEIDATEGGAFTTCNGRNHGYNLVLQKNKRIVQAWTHRAFPEGHYSIVDIMLEEFEGGTRLHFNHIGVPESCDGWLTEGWHKVYWEPLKNFLEKKLVS